MGKNISKQCMRRRSWRWGGLDINSIRRIFWPAGVSYGATCFKNGRTRAWVLRKTTSRCLGVVKITYWQAMSVGLCDY